MTELKNFTFGFVGLGLMGGSLAKGIRANILDTADSEGKIYAMDISKHKNIQLYFIQKTMGLNQLKNF